MKFNCQIVALYIIGDIYVVKSNGKFYYFINNELYHTSFIKIF